jgi:hypothetical protein
MISIINSTEYTLSPSSQEAIRNAAANYGGLDAVSVAKSAYDGGNATLFNVYDESGQTYLFSIDTDGDVIFDA